MTFPQTMWFIFLAFAIGKTFHDVVQCWVQVVIVEDIFILFLNSWGKLNILLLSRTFLYVYFILFLNWVGIYKQ